MTIAEDLHAVSLTSALDEQQLAELTAAGEEVTITEGEELFREGQPSDYLWILLGGRLELLRNNNLLATMATPGQWAGGLRAWEGTGGTAAYTATARCVENGRMFRVPSAELGRLVGEWLPLGKHLMLGVYQTVRTFEQTARQRASLVALGTLSAGLAHEINNPAAASLRAVEALRETCDKMLLSLGKLGETAITAEQSVELSRLRRDLITRPAPDMGAMATMEREDTIGTWLERRGIDDPWSVAPVLAATGADVEWLQELERGVGAEALVPAVEWVSTTVAMSTLLSELTDTTTRISQLVGAVRDYSQMDREPLQRVNVRDGIDNTLTMLAAKLDGVTVQREFGADVPAIDGYPGELNQVWTNLFVNAIDAMDGAGTLTVETRTEDNEIVVEVTDSGHGIDASLIGRVFEPFFTTKDVGKGTGLGLDISRRIIVDRHNGHIEFESRPGATTARVRLPISR
jgi:signal transduction histidine kinase